VVSVAVLFLLGAYHVFRRTSTRQNALSPRRA
jgi:hypothetical protein